MNILFIYTLAALVVLSTVSTVDTVRLVPLTCPIPRLPHHVYTRLCQLGIRKLATRRGTRAGRLHRLWHGLPPLPAAPSPPLTTPDHLASPTTLRHTPISFPDPVPSSPCANLVPTPPVILGAIKPLPSHSLPPTPLSATVRQGAACPATPLLPCLVLTDDGPAPAATPTPVLPLPLMSSPDATPQRELVALPSPSPASHASPPSTGIKVMLFNAHSVCDKTVELHDTLIDEQVDLAFFTESWLAEKGDEAKISELTPPSHSTVSFHRTSGTGGGGICITYCKALEHHLLHKRITSFQTFEAVDLRLILRNLTLNFLCVYRPPPSKRNKLKTSMFVKEFTELLDSCNCLHPVLIGDINLHFDSDSDCYVRKIKTSLGDLGLIQLIGEATQNFGHTLDWVVVRDSEPLISNISVRDLLLSDHRAIFFNICIPKPKRKIKYVMSRNLRKVNVNKLREDLREGLSCVGDASDRSLVEVYNASLTQALDKHAPLVSRRVTDRPSAPWLTDIIKNAKRDLRKTERLMCATGLTIHREIFKKQRNALKACVRKAKQEHYCTKLSECNTTKALFSITNSLFRPERKVSTTPKEVPSTELSDMFAEYFVEKIATIRRGLDDSADSEMPVFDIFSGTTLREFEHVSEAKVRKLILECPSKSCVLDPLPTSLLKNCIDDVVPFITKIMNVSLTHGIVPEYFKQAIVTPLLKKTGLDTEILKNYRPISNLPFLAKLLERIVLSQLQDHLQFNGLVDPLQSAYKKGHSTETALIHVSDLLLTNADSKDVSVLALLDLSAAFDTLDHEILLSRLNKTFGISGCALAWFTSYVKNRSQTVIVNGVQSNPRPLKFGVPQGSVLGPVLFMLYTVPLSDVIHQHGCEFHRYADDTQLESSSSPLNIPLILHNMELCISSVKKWMLSNKLCLNDSKTEAVCIGSRHSLSKLPATSFYVGDTEIPFQPKVRDLGVILDSNLSFHDHISQTCKSCYFELRGIASVRPFLTVNATIQLVTSLVLCRLDYCNSLLSGLPSSEISRLQRVQNNAARIILKKSKKDHVTPLLIELHWLPVEFRIKYKIATLAFRCFDGSLPPYLSSLLTIYHPSRSLRSCSEKLLKVPKTSTKTFGQRSFRYQAPTIWNSLPSHIRNLSSLTSFKSATKTFFFRNAFAL